MIRRAGQVVVALVISALFSMPAWPQATLLPNAKQQFIGNTGAPLASGTVDFYVPNTNTRKTTWQNSTQTTTNTNPVTLDAAGRPSSGTGQIFGFGSYRQVLKDSLGNTIWDAVTASTGGNNTIYTDVQPIGTILPYAGLAAPNNYLFAFGQAVNRTSFATLRAAITIVSTTATCTIGVTTVGGFADTSQIRVGAPIEASCLSAGTTVATIATGTSVTVSAPAASSGTVTATVFPFGNGNGSTTFNVPDMRGRVAAAQDVMPGSTAASRLTATGLGAAAVQGTGGGAQTRTITQANLPVVTLTTTIAAGQGSHHHTVRGGAAAAGSTFVRFNATANADTDPAGTDDATLPAMSGTTPLGGSGTALITVQPTLVVNYIIKYETSAGDTSGVISLGGMFGDIVCGGGVTCAGQTISFTGSGSGDVNGPASSTDNALVRFDGITGKLLQNSLATLSDDGTVTISPTAASSTRGLVINQTGPTSGTTAGDSSSNCWGANPSLVYNSVCINGEGTNVTGVAPVFTYGMNVGLVTGTTNSEGSKVALNALLFKASSSAPATPRDHVALGANAFADGGEGGTGTAIGLSKGTIFSAGFQVTARSGATNLLEVAGGEVDCSINTGASASYRFCWNLVSGGQVQGAVLDGGLVFGGTTIGFKNAILLANANGGAPVSVIGCIICTDGSANTVDSVLDVSTYTATTWFLRGPGSHFTVAGATGATIISNSGAFTALQMTDGTAVGVVTPSNLLTNSFAFGSTSAHPVTFVTTSALRMSIAAASPTVTIGLANTSQGILCLTGATSGTACQRYPAAAGAGTITWPSGTVDFGATGGTSQVVKQTSVGGIFTVARLACADLSDAAATCSSASGGSLVVGTTVITSGTTTRILFDNAGVLGEYTISGSGSAVAMATGATLTTAVAAGIWTASGTWTLPAHTLGGTISGGGNQINNVIIGTTTPLAGSFTTLASGVHTLTVLPAANTSTDGLILTDTTAASAGNQQYSPRIRLTGQGWKTDATAGSQTVDWKIENIPVQAAANPDAYLSFGSQINGGGYTDLFQFRNQVSSATTTFFINNASQSQFVLAVGGTGIGVHFVNSAQYIFGATAAVPVLFYTGNTQKAILSATGGFTIGDSSNPGVGGLRATGATIQFTALAADTAQIDATVCRVAATGTLYTGTGALGICLGTSGSQFKTSFAPMAAGIDEIMKINFQTYRYREGYGDGGERVQYGPTAQDVEAALPDLARHDQKGETINYDSGALLFVGMRAIQQLKADNDNLRQRIERLEKRGARK